jgi:DNA adenine methylase
MNFYRWIQRGLDTSVPFRNSRSVYEAHRRRFNALIAAGRADTREAASLSYYLNRTGYNGLCRFNRAGTFNVPFGRHGSIAYRTDFADYKPAFSRFRFLSVDFENLPLTAAT